MLLTGCGEVPVVDVQMQKGDTLKENLINANRHIANSEATQIDAYAARRGWKMTQLSSGARVMETRHGNGPKVEYEDTVSIRYRVEAINGATVYKDQEETVVSGQLQPNRGMDAALRILAQGARAKVILPSEQAFGVAGDGNRVKSRMILVYDVEVLKVKKMTAKEEK
ncbi:MAG: FKBP-type peptidyl-prolyl cis-trans isomerase [Bacteroidales bacterium]|nr:FKBP-type peptidyl-prolyl cis-trans isomerase [Bacteroidales bacterium]